MTIDRDDDDERPRAIPDDCLAFVNLVDAKELSSELEKLAPFQSLDCSRAKLELSDDGEGDVVDGLSLAALGDVIESR